MSKKEIKVSKQRYPAIDFDKLQMYFGHPYVIDLEGVQGSVTVYCPTLGDIIRIGEKKFFNTLNVFISNTTTYRSFLWDAGKDWNEVSDFELWITLMMNADKEVLNLLFGDLDFSTFNVYQRKKEIPKENEEDEQKFETEIFLYSEDADVEITEAVYQHFHQYLQEMFAMKPEEELTKDRMLKQWWIKKDKNKIERDKESGNTSSSSILSMISACVNHPGFKYKPSELEEIPICQFYDSVKRLQIYENATATLRGMYSGLALGGAKDLKPDDYNFMREIQ